MSFLFVAAIFGFGFCCCCVAASWQDERRVLHDARRYPIPGRGNHAARGSGSRAGGEARRLQHGERHGQAGGNRGEAGRYPVVMRALRYGTERCDTVRRGALRCFRCKIKSEIMKEEAGWAIDHVGGDKKENREMCNVA